MSLVVTEEGISCNISSASTFVGETKDLPFFQNFEEMPRLLLTLITLLHNAMLTNRVC